MLTFSYRKRRISPPVPDREEVRIKIKKPSYDGKKRREYEKVKKERKD